MKIDPPRPALANLASLLDQLRLGRSVASIHHDIQAAERSGKAPANGQRPVRMQAKHFSAQWTAMRNSRKVPPYASMVLPVVICLSSESALSETIAEAERRWRDADAEEHALPGRRPDAGPMDPAGPAGLSSLDATSTAQPRHRGAWVELAAGVAAIAAGVAVADLGLDARGPAGWTVSAAGALVAAVGAGVVRRAIARLRHRLTLRADRSNPPGP